MDPTSWTTGKSRTRTSFLPLSYFIQFCYLPTSFLFTQMWPSSQRPLSGSFIMSLDLAKNRGTEIIWTKERDALGFGFQPPCQRAKMADCPSVSLISICLQLCPASAGAKVGEPSCWVNFRTKKLHIYFKAEPQSERKGLDEDQFAYFNSSINTMQNIFFWRLKRRLWQSVLWCTCEES